MDRDFWTKSYDKLEGIFDFLVMIVLFIITWLIILAK